MSTFTALFAVGLLSLCGSAFPREYDAVLLIMLGLGLFEDPLLLLLVRIDHAHDVIHHLLDISVFLRRCLEVLDAVLGPNL